METLVPDLGDAFHANFLNFLRGMETGIERWGIGRHSGFLNFLRGMETPTRSLWSNRRSSLPKLP